MVGINSCSNKVMLIISSGNDNFLYIILKYKNLSPTSELNRMAMYCISFRQIKVYLHTHTHPAHYRLPVMADAGCLSSSWSGLTMVFLSNCLVYNLLNVRVPTFSWNSPVSSRNALHNRPLGLVILVYRPTSSTVQRSCLGGSALLLRTEHRLPASLQ